MISHNYKIIFVHVIKTAGSSIQNVLNLQQVSGHASAKRIRHIVGDIIWNEYFKFTFVRNPYDKIVSQYHYNRHQFGFESSTFKEYILAWNSGECISTFPQQHSEYLDADLDCIYRFENLQGEINRLCDKIGIPHQKLPHINKSKHKHYTEYYDDETREIVAQKFAKDIELFGYEFGE